jgi:hypothetical protein
MALELEELSGQVIGSAIEVHRTLGPGFVESIYEEALVVELKAIKDLNPDHFAMVRSYLRAVDRQHGLLLNFAKATLDIKRVLARPSPD